MAGAALLIVQTAASSPLAQTPMTTFVVAAPNSSLAGSTPARTAGAQTNTHPETDVPLAARPKATTRTVASLGARHARIAMWALVGVTVLSGVLTLLMRFRFMRAWLPELNRHRYELATLAAAGGLAIVGILVLRWNMRK